MMEYYKGKLCISGSELILSGDNPDGIMTICNYKALSSRGRFQVLRRACYGTPALISFDSLPERYRNILKDRMGGDPHRALQSNSIADAIIYDEKAREFFNTYPLPEGESLPFGAIEEYCSNAEVLTAFHQVLNETKAYRKSRGGSTTGLFENMVNVLQDLDRSKYPHSLPTNPVRLREKLNRYLKEGYSSMIHRGYGNRNTEKLTEDARRWALARWSNPVERVTSVEHLLELYNQEAPARAWKQLFSVGTIRNYLYDPEVKHLWWGVRYGQLKSKQKFSLQHSTSMPTMRDSLWYSDGTKMNFFYLNEEGKMETCQVYEVMDAFSEVLLGYHISKTEDYQAQFRAYKMAIQFAGQKPYQIGYDNQGGHKKLENGNFLNKVAHLAIKAQPYNGKSKTIELAFGRFQSQIMKRHWFFTGQNITATSIESRANMEYILANKNNLPSLEQVKKIYAQDRQAWNEGLHHKTEKPRIEMYRGSYNPAAVEVSMLDMVNIFWIMRPDPVMLSAYGLSITEKKIKYDYLVYRDGKPDFDWLRSNIDRKFYVKYDPDDMSLVYLYKKDSAGGLRFVTEAMPKVVVCRGKQEQSDDDAAWIIMVNEANKLAIIKDLDKITDVRNEFDMTPEHYGLTTPGIPGIKDKKPVNIGRVHKAVSNLTELEEEEETDIYSLM